MAQYKYATKTENEENIAKTVGRDIGISAKQTIEVCNFIRKKNVDDAKKILEDVIAKKMVVPFKRFTEGAGHKKGAGAGKYPVRCCREILRLLNQAAANASFKGLNPSNMVIKALVPQKAAKRWHYGRKRRRKMKRTNLEIVLEEIEVRKEEKPAVKKEEARKVEEKKKETPKPAEPKKAEEKIEKKEEPKEVKKE
ncbi:50S ribosomal protein L22 [Candidatus Woesearchaeota archaeon]|nr:50S ribosomal protein L22 [Candidatus Woesearchaeota archaeon]